MILPAYVLPLAWLWAIGAAFFPAPAAAQELSCDDVRYAVDTKPLEEIEAIKAKMTPAQLAAAEKCLTRAQKKRLGLK